MLASFYFGLGLVIKLFLLLTPFFVLSVFVTACNDMEHDSRRKLALRTGFAVICACLVLYLFGERSSLSVWAFPSMPSVSVPVWC